LISIRAYRAYSHLEKPESGKHRVEKSGRRLGEEAKWQPRGMEKLSRTLPKISNTVFGNF
jgi:hypothetical protein